MTGRARALVVALVIFAVAVGILIGSGPLRAGIGAGTSQADRLEQAIADAEAAEEAAQQGTDFAEAVGPAAVAGRLDGQAIAVVRTPDASEDDAADAAARLDDAGATIAASVSLTEDWTAEDRAPFRDALAAQIAAALPDPPTGATTSQVLAAALAQALAAGDEFDGQGQERADTLWTLLTEAKLVAGERTEDADLFLLVTSDAEVADLGAAFSTGSSGAVVGFTGAESSPAGGSSTVTRAASFYGAWAVAGAMIGVANGTVGEYDASDADELIGSVGQ